MPQEPIPHFVNITFNDEGIPSNPFQCRVIAKKTSVQKSPKKTETSAIVARGDGLKQAVFNSKTVFDIDTNGSDIAPVVRISDPYSFNVSSYLTETRPGLYRAEFTPTKLGTHNISITVGDRPIPESPFKTEVFDPASVKVTDIGAAVIGAECSLTVDVSSAGHGALSVAVRTAGQEVNITDLLKLYDLVIKTIFVKKRYFLQIEVLFYLSMFLSMSLFLSMSMFVFIAISGRGHLCVRVPVFPCSLPCLCSCSCVKEKVDWGEYTPEPILYLETVISLPQRPSPSNK